MLRSLLLASAIAALAACSPPQQQSADTEKAASASTTEALTPEADPASVIAPETTCGDWSVASACYTASAELEFGAPVIGARQAAPPPSAVRADSCAEGDCEYADAGGVRYLLFDGEVSRKRIVVAPGQALPFGLTGRETPELALAHMNQRFNIPFVLEDREEARIVHNEGTLKNSAGHAFWLDIAFSPDGAMTEIVLQGPPTE